MKHIILTLLCLVLSQASTFAAYKVEPTRSVVYKTVQNVDGVDRPLKLHIFEPHGHSASDKRPVIVFFFGGGWVSGGAGQFFPYSQYLASRGIVAISAEYRTRNTHGTSPRECVIDGNSALRWVRENSAALGIDPEQILAGGGSAGGQVAAATALCHGFDEPGEDTSVSTRPAALVLFNPVIDNGPIGWGHERVKDYWEAFSPLHNITSNAPPTAIFLGTADKLIPVATVEKYRDQMEAVGSRCELHLYEAQPHGFFNANHVENYRKVVAAMDGFLVSLGYLNTEE